jgi:HEAT repeat protein
VRIFLDANILFSAARSQGAMRELLHLLQSIGHTLVADEYVVAEAHRNLGAKESGQAVKDLLTLLSVVEVSACSGHPSSADVSWLPPKDWPVLLAAIDLARDRSEQPGQSCGRADRDSSVSLAIAAAKMGLVAGHKDVTRQIDCRQQDRPILGRQPGDIGA